MSPNPGTIKYSRSSDWTLRCASYRVTTCTQPLRTFRVSPSVITAAEGPWSFALISLFFFLCPVDVGDGWLQLAPIGALTVASRAARRIRESAFCASLLIRLENGSADCTMHAELSPNPRDDETLASIAENVSSECAVKTNCKWWRPVASA